MEKQFFTREKKKLRNYFLRDITVDEKHFTVHLLNNEDQGRLSKIEQKKIL